MADLNIRLDIRITSSLARWIGAACCLALMTTEVSPESVTLDTYYPAPSGIYMNMVTTQQTVLARDGGNVGIGTSNPNAQLVVGGNGTLQLGKASNFSGAACSPEGTLAYDYTLHEPIYCGQSRTWTSGLSVTMGAMPVEGNELNRNGADGWIAGNNGSGYSTFAAPDSWIVGNVGANRNCLAVIGTYGETNGTNNSEIGDGCRYDPGTGNIIASVEGNQSVSCVYICTN